MKKILVNCEVSLCRHNVDGYCELDELHLVVSYGRSTDYVHEFQCEDVDPRSAVRES